MWFDCISFTTDYGLDDGFVAACHGVMAKIAPHVRVLDVTHTVTPGDVRKAATTLAQTVAYLPPAVHLAVVDPGVGTARRAIAVVVDDGLLVGPDNGVLLPAAETLGGVREAYELSTPEYRLATVSSTFHGRDIFAPAAAHLATGVAPSKLGQALDIRALKRLPSLEVVVAQGKLVSEVVATDRFGNVQLAARPADLTKAGFHDGDRLAIRAGTIEKIAYLGDTFADVPDGDPVVITDSAGHVAIAVNGGSATKLLGDPKKITIS
ncbi:SAM hydrolase/SAM-dependent halogenase family protein [Herbihabitans rhizosphaerae]|uniref:SAM hydrolase/SAM-dependent halogenase family protein n=1 Tax=Herbihabitans rhizosphaerae TaxID=1872711 RepID=UPI00102C8794|nr:SAM-dependent chlorinase/fluorinase [Herbihabitans rhizosphaerae]